MAVEVPGTRHQSNFKEVGRFVEKEEYVRVKVLVEAGKNGGVIANVYCTVRYVKGKGKGVGKRYGSGDK